MNITYLEIFAVGFIIGFLVMGIAFLRSGKMLKEYKRKLEKTSINSTEESSKVSVLEAKIQTLEKALQSALENK